MNHAPRGPRSSKFTWLLAVAALLGATNPTLARLPDGSIDFSPFLPASGSDLINAGVVPQGELPFDPSYYRGMPDLGAVETP